MTSKMQQHEVMTAGTLALAVSLAVCAAALLSGCGHREYVATRHGDGHDVVGAAVVGDAVGVDGDGVDGDGVDGDGVDGDVDDAAGNASPASTAVPVQGTWQGRNPHAARPIPTYPESLEIWPHDAGLAPRGAVQPCQALGPAAPWPVDGVDCADGRCRRNGPGEGLWNARSPIPWQSFAQGEYAGPARLAHVPEYRLRPDDTLEFIYRLTRDESAKPYELNVGDTIKVESLIDPKLDRELVIQPDGTITLRLLGQVRAARLNVDQLRQILEEQYTKYYPVPAITVTPVRVNTKLEDIRAAVNSQFGAGGQTRVARVTPEGTVQLVAIGSVPAQGLTLDELRVEVNERYAQVVDGLEVTPVLQARAPRYVYVLGEVRQPGRFVLEGPTTVMQSLALAGSWINGGNVREIVVFRRAEDWRLIATRLDLRGALLGHRPCPADEIWLRDSDVVIVPKSPILLTTDFIELVFTRGIYGVIPFQGVTIGFAKASTI